MTRRRRLLFRAAAAALTLAAVELLSMFAARAAADRYGLLYREYGTTEEYARYLAVRHPVLGWPLSDPEINRDRDATGSRISPAFPDPAVGSCVSLYGDSFTFSAEVDHEHAWGNLLARELRCRVANFGMGGYGTDQAYLRFKLNDADASATVILGIFSENVMRNVNRYRNLFYPSRFGMKPRFAIDPHGGRLELVPMPDIAAADYERFVADPDPFLPRELYTLGGAWGQGRLAFPYTLALLRAAGNFRVRAALTGTPHWAPFYRDDHPSGALQVTRAIAAAFRDEAARRGKRALVVMLPHRMDVTLRERGEPWTYGRLVELMRSDGVDVVDVGEEMMQRLDAEERRRLVRGQHYSEEGYRFVADVVAPRLRRDGARVRPWTPPGGVASTPS